MPEKIELTKENLQEVLRLLDVVVRMLGLDALAVVGRIHAILSEAANNKAENKADEAAPLDDPLESQELIA